MFKRSKTEAAAPAPTVVKPGGKNRPTPTRKEAEAAAKARAKAPVDRKGRGRADRTARAESSREIREGMKRGEEKYLLPRDKGPVRRFIRDYVDARFSIIEMVIPLMIIGLILGYTGSSPLVQASSLILLATVVFVVLDMFFLRFRLRRELRRRFPEASLKGTTYYGISRAMQMRFMRLPKTGRRIGETLPDSYR